ncbi:MAG: YdeI/OmpD-associated family protein [Verrucomicrobiota bacterium]
MKISSRIEKEPESGYHVIPVPEKIANELKAAGHKRILLTIDHTIHRRALMNTALGDHFIIFGKNALQQHHLKLGDPVTAQLTTDPNPDAIDIPPELEEALHQDEPALTRWNTFTPGKQRSLCHHVTSAKRPETRARRAVELTEKIRTHTLHTDKK